MYSVTQNSMSEKPFKIKFSFNWTWKHFRLNVCRMHVPVASVFSYKMSYLGLFQWKLNSTLIWHQVSYNLDSGTTSYWQSESEFESHSTKKTNPCLLHQKILIVVTGPNFWQFIDFVETELSPELRGWIVCVRWESHAEYHKMGNLWSKLKNVMILVILEWFFDLWFTLYWSVSRNDFQIRFFRLQII